LADYYEILGVSQSADSTQIRTAYKKMAMRWHPDRNPNNPQAEEMFKAINEAYHVLSDPLKKSRYDSRFYSQTVSNDEEHWREMQRQQYERRQQARKWQQERPAKRYVFDAHYFKIQGLALLVFLVMAGICFTIIQTANYVIDSKYEKIRVHNRQLVMEVNSLFGAGKIEEAAARISALYEKEPLDFQFIHARDSLVNALRNHAEKNFIAQKFDQSLRYLKCLRKYETPARTETLRKIGVCEYNLGSYEDALRTFKQLHTQQPWNLDLIYMIGSINLNYFDNKEEAMTYFTMGTRLFRENLTEIYGEAYTVVMDPKDVQDIYVDIFVARANANMVLKNYKEAMRDLNWAIYLRPLRSDAYKYRALAEIKVKSYSKACADLEQAKKLGENGIPELQNKYCR
jgi:tetratricopeptide (TPR) repeat protein